MTDTFTKFVPNFDAIIEFHKANLEALVQVQNAFAKGVEDMSKEFLAIVQTNLETAAHSGKAALAAKTIQEVIELNVEGMKGNYAKLVAGTNRLGELGVQVANDTFAPVKARVTAAAETIKAATAA